VKDNDSDLRNSEFLFTISTLLTKKWDIEAFNKLGVLRDKNSIFQVRCFFITSAP
jgi:hypothetical protein